MAVQVDYTKWPIESDVQRRLDAIGVTLRRPARIVEATEAVVSEVAQITLRQFVADTAPRTMTYDGTGTSEMEIDEIVSLTSVFLTGIAGAPGYSLTNVQPIVEQNKPITRLIVGPGSLAAYTSEAAILPYPLIFPAGRQNIQVTGLYGYGAEIPEDLWEGVCGEIARRCASEATYVQAGRLVEQMQGDTRKKWDVQDVDVLGWGKIYRGVLSGYTRSSGRRLRNMRPRMI